MAKSSDGYATAMRRFCVELVEFSRARMPPGFDDSMWARVRSVIETSSSKRDLRGLVSDLVEGAACLSDADVRDLDRRLSALGLPTLTAMRSSEHRRFQEILSGGRFRNEEEYRFVEGRMADVGPTGPSDDERAIANEMLLAHV